MASNTGTISVTVVDDVADPWATLSTALEAGHSRVVMVDLDLSPDPVRVHSHIGELVYDSKTWLGIGNIGGLSDLDPGSDLSAAQIQLRLALVNNEALRATMAQMGYQGTSAEIHLGAVDNTTGQLIAAAPVWWGFIDRALVENDVDTSMVTVNLTDELARHDTPANGTYTHEDQIVRYPGDLFLEHVQRTQDMTLPWGPQS